MFATTTTTTTTSTIRHASRHKCGPDPICADLACHYHHYYYYDYYDYYNYYNDYYYYHHNTARKVGRNGVQTPLVLTCGSQGLAQVPLQRLLCCSLGLRGSPVALGLGGQGRDRAASEGQA